MSLRGTLHSLEAMNKANKRDELLKELTEIFDEVARDADKCADIDTRVKLKVAAANGKGKISDLKSVI